MCIRGIKGDAVAIGKLERFVADWAREHHVTPKTDMPAPTISLKDIFSLKIFIEKGIIVILIRIFQML